MINDINLKVENYISKKEKWQKELVLLRAVFSALPLEETLKWGEPSYLTKGGGTIRMDWKKSKPDQYAMYFNCKTKLVYTFKELYKDEFKYEGNRAIVFHKNDKIPINELKHCILLSLTYHSRKHLPLLDV